MTLRGSLETMSYAETLQILGSAQRTGTLRLESCGRRRVVQIVEGDVRAVGSDPPIDLVRRILLARTDLVERELHEVFDISRRSGRPAHEILAAVGRFTREQLTDLFAAKARGWVLEPASWMSGTFAFLDGDDLPGGPLAMTHLRWQDVARAAAEHRDRAACLHGVLPGLDAAYTPAPRSADESALPPMEIRVLDLVESGMTGVEICAHVDAADLEILETLARLVRRGAIAAGRIARVEAPDAHATIALSAALADAGRPCEALVTMSRSFDGLPDDDATNELRRKLCARAMDEAKAVLGNMAGIPERLVPARTSDPRLPPLEAAVLELVDGRRTVRAISDALPSGEARQVALAVLATFLRRGVVVLRAHEATTATQVAVSDCVRVAAPVVRQIPETTRAIGARRELDAAPGGWQSRRIGSHDPR